APAADLLRGGRGVEGFVGAVVRRSGSVLMAVPPEEALGRGKESGDRMARASPLIRLESSRIRSRRSRTHPLPPVPATAAPPAPESGGGRPEGYSSGNVPEAGCPCHKSPRPANPAGTCSEREAAWSLRQGYQHQAAWGCVSPDAQAIGTGERSVQS